MIKIGNRKNDNAMVSLIEFIDVTPTIEEGQVDDEVKVSTKE